MTHHDMPPELWVALAAALATGAVAALLALGVVVRTRPADTVAPVARARYPARTLERAFVVGGACAAVAAAVVVDVAGVFDNGAVVGGLAVVAAAAFVVWRGAFMSLRDSPPAEDR